MNNDRVTWKQFFRSMASLAIPVALQNVLFTTASMVDTIMLGSMGEQAVAAIGICAQISSLFIQLYWGFVSGAVIFFSQYWGARDEDGINRTFGILTIYLSVIGFSFGLLSVVQPSLLLGIYTDKQALIAIGTPYMRIVGWSYILQVFAMQASCLLRSTERVKVPLYISMSSLSVNFVVNWVLIYGRFGFPQMGAAGAAVGTLVSQIMNTVLLFAVLKTSRGQVRILWKKIWRIDGAFSGLYFKKAFPIVINEAMYGVGQMLINICIGHQDEPAIAAMAAFRVCEGFVMSFFFGLASATSVLVGKEVGSGKPERAYSLAQRAVVFCPLFTFVLVLISVFCYRPLYGLFGLGATAVYYGKYMLLQYLLFGSIRTCNYIMNDTFRAGGESVFGSAIEVCGLFLIAVPLTWLGGMVWGLPFLIVFALLYSDEAIRFPILLYYLLGGKWIKPVTEQGKLAVAEFMEERKKKRA